MKKMNSLLGQGGFQPAKCKTQLRLGMARIKLLRNKKLSRIASDRREVAEFLRNGQESNARLRVEHIIREQNLIEGYDLLFVYAERITAQLTVIDSQKTCPPELKEDISTLLFGSSRCAELTDFPHIRPMFVAKYGKEFVSAAEELRPGCGVNGRVVEKLSVSRASGEAKLQMMKDIAAEHNVQWDPAPFEDEIGAVPNDLLDGPTKFTSAEPIDDLPSVPNRICPLPIDDENFTTTSRTERRMSLPGGSVRDKSRYQGNRTSDSYDAVRPSGRRATIGPEEIRPARAQETEDPPPSRYGEREKQSDRRLSAPFEDPPPSRYGEREKQSDRRLSAPLPKDDIMEGRQSPNYSSQKYRPDRHRKGDIPAVYDDDRPPRFSNPKVGLQASLDDEHSPNTHVPRDRSDRPRKSDMLPRYDDDNPPPRFIKVGKQSTLDDEDLPSGRSSPRIKGEKPQRFVNSPRHDESLQATPRPRSNLQSVKTDPDLASAPRTPAPEHRKTQSASDGQPQSKPVFMKPPDLDVLIQMFGNKGKKK